MSIEIKELYKIKESEYEAVYQMLLEAFAKYPKLQVAFPDEKTRMVAIEMVLRFYGQYDLTYGAGFSLDENLNEAVFMMHSDYVGFSDEMARAAGCYSEVFQSLSSRLSKEDVARWEGVFEELDQKEAALNLPKPYLYLDFVAVRRNLQGEGRGSRLIQAVCSYAREQGLPVMLFTNGEEDVAFYKKNGFRIVGVTRSETYGFENTYMWYEDGRTINRTNRR